MKTKFVIVCLMLIPGSLAFSAEPLTLEKFLKDVKEHNLDLRAEAAKTQAADAKATGIELPAPMIGFIQMDMEDGTSVNGFEISQSIPFPTKLAAGRSARKYEFQAQKEMELAQQNEIFAKAKLAYFNLWSAQAKLSTFLEKKSVIDHHIKLATSAVRSDSFLRLHLLKAESDRDILENEIEGLRALILEKQLQLAQFVYSDPSSFKPELIEPPISTIPEKHTFKSAHQIESLRLTYEGYRSREFEAKSTWFPDFELRYKEMGESSMFPSYKEYMVGVSVPFAFFWEPYSIVSAAKAESVSAELQYKKERQKIESEVISLTNKAESLKRQISVLKDKLLPRAEKRMKIAHNLAPRDIETLQDHRETMEAFPELKMKSIELREQYEEVVAELEKYASRRGSP